MTTRIEWTILQPPRIAWLTVQSPGEYTRVATTADLHAAGYVTAAEAKALSTQVSKLAFVVSQALVIATLAPGERYEEPSKHALVDAVERLRDRAEKAERELERMKQLRVKDVGDVLDAGTAVEQERDTEISRLQSERDSAFRRGAEAQKEACNSAIKRWREDNNDLRRWNQVLAETPLVTPEAGAKEQHDQSSTRREREVAPQTRTGRSEEERTASRECDGGADDSASTSVRRVATAEDIIRNRAPKAVTVAAVEQFGAPTENAEQSSTRVVCTPGAVGAYLVSASESPQPASEGEERQHPHDRLADVAEKVLAVHAEIDEIGKLRASLQAAERKVGELEKERNDAHHLLERASLREAAWLDAAWEATGVASTVRGLTTLDDVICVQRAELLALCKPEHLPKEMAKRARELFADSSFNTAADLVNEMSRMAGDLAPASPPPRRRTNMAEKTRAELNSEWEKFSAALVFVDAATVDDARRKLSELLAAERTITAQERRKIQAGALRWAITRLSHRDNAHLELNRYADGILDGTLTLPEDP